MRTAWNKVFWVKSQRWPHQIVNLVTTVSHLSFSYSFTHIHNFPCSMFLSTLSGGQFLPPCSFSIDSGSSPENPSPSRWESKASLEVPLLTIRIVWFIFIINASHYTKLCIYSFPHLLSSIKCKNLKGGYLLHLAHWDITGRSGFPMCHSIAQTGPITVTFPCRICTLK